MSEKEGKEIGDESLQKTDSQKETPNPESDGTIPEELLESIPEEDRGRVASIIRQTMISGVMRRNNPIADKITSEHITQLISKSDDQDKRDRQERRGERNYNLLLIIIALVFVGFYLPSYKRMKIC